MRPLVWDTCAAIWIYDQAELSKTALDLLAAAHQGGVPSYVSPITAWEVGLLSSRGRLQLRIAPERWFAKLFEIPGVHIAPMPPELLVASSFLPGKPPRDPADRAIEREGNLIIGVADRRARVVEVLEDRGVRRTQVVVSLPNQMRDHQIVQRIECSAQRNCQIARTIGATQLRNIS